MADQEWPFDADQNDPLAAMRIPVVATAYPRWRYEVALCIGELWHDPPLRPTDAEAEMIASFIGYRRSYYRGGWQAKMLERPLDVDGSTNTIILLKVGDAAWCHRLDSWQSGPPFVPDTWGESKSTLSLAALLDRIVSWDGVIDPPLWREWKAAHPEVFGEAVDA